MVWVTPAAWVKLNGFAVVVVNPEAKVKLNEAELVRVPDPNAAAFVATTGPAPRLNVPLNVLAPASVVVPVAVERLRLDAVELAPLLLKIVPLMTVFPEPAKDSVNAEPFVLERYTFPKVRVPLLPTMLLVNVRLAPLSVNDPATFTELVPWKVSVS